MRKYRQSEGKSQKIQERVVNIKRIFSIAYSHQRSKTYRKMNINSVSGHLHSNWMILYPTDYPVLNGLELRLMTRPDSSTPAGKKPKTISSDRRDRSV